MKNNKDSYVACLQPHKSGWYKNGMPWIQQDSGSNNACKKGVIPSQEKVFEQHKEMVSNLVQTKVAKIINLDFPDNSQELFKDDANINSEILDTVNKYSQDNIVFIRDSFISNEKDKIIFSKFRNLTRLEEVEVVKKLVLKILEENNINREIILPPDDNEVFYEGGDFRYIPTDGILFAGLDKENNHSRNSEKGIEFVANHFQVEKENLLVINGKGFHVDTVFSAVTNSSGSLVGGIVCGELVSNLKEIENFFEYKGLKLFIVGKEYGIPESKESDIGNGSINTLQLNEYLFSGGKFSQNVEKELKKLGVKRVISATGEFWKAGGGVHCLTNKI